MFNHVHPATRIFLLQDRKCDPARDLVRGSNNRLDTVVLRRLIPGTRQTFDGLDRIVLPALNDRKLARELKGIAIKQLETFAGFGKDRRWRAVWCRGRELARN